MTIKRRFKVVKLYQGGYEQELEDLLKVLTKAKDEDQQNRRMGSKSKSAQAAKAYDAKLAEAEDDAVTVKVYAIDFRMFDLLADEHPAREDDDEDARFGVNMKTFPPVLAEVSLVEDEAVDDLDELRAAGRLALRGLGRISRVHWVKIRNAAWNVNVGSDELPKFSAVSWLQQIREKSSTSQSDSESAPEG